MEHKYHIYSNKLFDCSTHKIKWMLTKNFKGLSSKQRNSYWKCLVEFSLKYIVLCIYFLKNDLFIRLPVTTIHIISYGKLQTHYRTLTPLRSDEAFTRTRHSVTQEPQSEGILEVGRKHTLPVNFAPCKHVRKSIWENSPLYLTTPIFFSDQIPDTVYQYSWCGFFRVLQKFM